MSYEFVIYLDEADDAGFGKLREPAGSGQTRWFAVGCCIVSRNHDLQLPKWRDDIVSRIPGAKRQDIHFRDLRGHDAKVFVCQSMAKLRLGISVALSNKITLLDMKKRLLDQFKQPDHLQNYLTRYVLERASRCIKLRAQKMGLATARAKVVFSQRGRMNYGAFREYLELIRGGRERKFSPSKIDWDVIDPELVDVQPHAKLAGFNLRTLQHLRSGGRWNQTSSTTTSLGTPMSYATA